MEYIIAKKLTRSSVSREDWNRLWHDHQLEIATGRLQVHDLSPDKTKEVADLVATTDGIIFSFDLKGSVPTGQVGQEAWAPVPPASVWGSLSLSWFIRKIHARKILPITTVGGSLVTRERLHHR